MLRQGRKPTSWAACYNSHQARKGGHMHFNILDVDFDMNRWYDRLWVNICAVHEAVSLTTLFFIWPLVFRKWVTLFVFSFQWLLKNKKCASNRSFTNRKGHSNACMLNMKLQAGDLKQTARLYPKAKIISVNLFHVTFGKKKRISMFSQSV